MKQEKIITAGIEDFIGAEIKSAVLYSIKFHNILVPSNNRRIEIQNYGIIKGIVEKEPQYLSTSRFHVLTNLDIEIPLYIFKGEMNEIRKQLMSWKNNLEACIHRSEEVGYEGVDLLGVYCINRSDVEISLTLLEAYETFREKRLDLAMRILETYKTKEIF